jgi:DNA polymerase-3 subunit chi
MTEISFYHLLNTSVEKAIPQLVEKLLESGLRGLIRTGSEERAEVISSLLWTYDTASFIPHGTKHDANALEQPIWITSDEENSNGAEIILLIDGMTCANLKSYRRCLDIFDGRDANALRDARVRWQSYNDSGHAITYWRQTEVGGWEKKV